MLQNDPHMEDAGSQIENNQEHVPIKVRTRTVLVSLALLLLVLGTGNLYYGSRKVRQCMELIAKVERNLSHPQSTIIPLADPTVNTDREQQQIRRLKVSQRFYLFVQYAGLWMIVIGVCASAGSLLIPLQYLKDR